jgi:hypothetical protein
MAAISHGAPTAAIARAVRMTPEAVKQIVGPAAVELPEARLAGGE